MKLQRKTVPFHLQKADGEAGTFEGYGAVFGNVDAYGDVIEPGAFAESIEEIRASGKPLKMLWQHQWYTPIGGYPGEKLKEDDHGLHVFGKLTMGVQKAAEANALMADQVLDGLSIGYEVLGEHQETVEGVRINRLTQIKLWEISPVTFPANELALIDGDSVKSRLARGELVTKRDLEAFLRDAGFSRGQAKGIVAQGHAGLVAQRDAGAEVLREATRLRQLLEAPA